ncbi:hypothetical protein HU200_039264 [Digitaria exilis]|uniref:F-box associated beta-propeller type 1 domain-containing protein n=1 Tax=Digitaria exilis TaxID=1010633 RepID=A0A835EFL2_9POAL|nr:hypothetical protein HU200_039264 [Digitaria exilis]CAB3447291.1 unnamed protein product [Digitaria exilis]
MRVVCKRWHALTSEHHFLCTSFSRNTTGHSIAGFFLSDHLYSKFSYVPLGQSIAGNSSHQTTVPDLSFIPTTPAVDRGQIYVTASCNGLLVCGRPNISVLYKSTWYVCNPLTKKFIEIAVPEGITHFLYLAYDPSKSQHYKILALGNYDIHVYYSQTRSWRIPIHFDESEYPLRGLHCYHSVFWNGSLVWVVQNRLVRYVVDEDEYQGVEMMPMPQTPEGWMCAYVGESGGHLQMVGFTEEERIAGVLNVLEMQEGSSEWSALYRVDLRRVVELYPSIRRTEREYPYIGLRYGFGRGRMIERLALWPMHVVRGSGERGRGGMMLFSIPGKIMCYHTDSQKFSIVYGEPVAPEPGTYQFHWYHFTPYNPSLFAV